MTDSKKPRRHWRRLAIVALMLAAASGAAWYAMAKEVVRMSMLAQRDFASQQTYQRTVSDHGQALAAVAAARQCLDDLTLIAPLDGEVVR